jgi:hypothetical protein
VSILNVDGAVSPSVLDELRRVDEILLATTVRIRV